jgi:hypothetical protein
MPDQVRCFTTFIHLVKKFPSMMLDFHNRFYSRIKEIVELDSQVLPMQ